MTDDTSAADVEATDLRFVGDATAAVLERADIDAAAIAERRASYEMLCEAGVNPGVAARIRREHSLPWSFDHTDGERLQRRSRQVRKLRDGEREWIAASAEWGDDDEEGATPDGGRTAEEAERAWREES